MDEPEKTQLYRDFLNELQTLQDTGGKLPILLTAAEAFMLLSALQLVLRHPALSRDAPAGPSLLGEFVREVAVTIQQGISVTPALTRVAAMGWDQTYDVPTTLSFQ